MAAAAKLWSPAVKRSSPPPLLGDTLRPMMGRRQARDETRAGGAERTTRVGGEAVAVTTMAVAMAAAVEVAAAAAAAKSKV